jgi:hypothetical protein
MSASYDVENRNSSKIQAKWSDLLHRLCEHSHTYRTHETPPMPDPMHCSSLVTLFFKTRSVQHSYATVTGAPTPSSSLSSSSSSLSYSSSSTNVASTPALVSSCTLVSLRSFCHRINAAAACTRKPKTLGSYLRMLFGGSIFG